MSQFVTNVSFNGNCEEVFNFYKEVFNGELRRVSRASDMPPMEWFPPLSEQEAKKIIHIELFVNDKIALIWADVFENMGDQFKQGNNLEVCIMADSREQADVYFSWLSAWGNVVMPMDVQFWWDYYWMCVDKFGIGWMINVAS